MDFVTLLQPLGTAGAIIVAAIVLMREMKKLTNGGGLAKKMDSLAARVENVEKDVSYIRGKMDVAPADCSGAHNAQ